MKKQPGEIEFITLMAFTMSMVALTLDSMLPAFSAMTQDLQLAKANDIQLVIAFLLIGLSVGQLFYGPLSDSVGRKPAIYVGFVIFIMGCFLSMVADDFFMMLTGRFLQGLGAAGPRILSTALIRDRYSGSDMARIMSFIISVFIVVPIFAPFLGQMVLLVAGWRAIFAALVFLAILTLTWLAIRQPETLDPSRRMAFTMRKINMAFREVFKNRIAMLIILITGFINGMFIAYLSLCQQIFQVQYGLGTKFPLYFAILAFAVGLASLLNGNLVMRFGMHRLSYISLSVLMYLTWIFSFLVWQHDGHMPLWMFMASCLAMFFAIGILFGNLNSIAMEPLGHVAGTASSVVGSATTVISVVIGYLTGQAYDGTLVPLAVCFMVLATVSRLIMVGIKNSWEENPAS